MVEHVDSGRILNDDWGDNWGDDWGEAATFKSLFLSVYRNRQIQSIVYVVSLPKPSYSVYSVCRQSTETLIFSLRCLPEGEEHAETNNNNNNSLPEGEEHAVIEGGEASGILCRQPGRHDPPVVVLQHTTRGAKGGWKFSV